MSLIVLVMATMEMGGKKVKTVEELQEKIIDALNSVYKIRWS